VDVQEPGLILLYIAIIVLSIGLGILLAFIITRQKSNSFFKRRTTNKSGEQRRLTNPKKLEVLEQQAKQQDKPADSQLTIKLGSGLIPLNFAVIILILVIFAFQLDIIRIVLGIPFLIFFPGYALMVAIFPAKGRLSGLERIILSLALSISVVPLIGLILNYTWEIKLVPVISSTALFVVITSIIAWLRQANLAKQERLGSELLITKLVWRRIIGERVWDKVIVFTLVAALLGAFGILGYVIASPRFSETYTEFYILGQGGKAADYSSELWVGKEQILLLGIVNHEGREISYRVVVTLDGKTCAQMVPIILSDKEKWEGGVSFIPELAAENQKLEVLLYRDNDITPYLAPLQMWVDIRSATPSPVQE
jgi:uncharacterized membrane protein